jgi:hypothetical protein
MLTRTCVGVWRLHKVLARLTARGDDRLTSTRWWLDPNANVFGFIRRWGATATRVISLIAW